MKGKRIGFTLVTAAFCMNLISATASAHNGDVFGGTYIGKTNADFVLRINSSVQNDVFTYANVFRYGTDWNNYSSKVQLGLVMAGPGVPTINNQLNVNGVVLEDDGVEFVAGRMIPYDSNGYPCSANDNWSGCIIEINVSDSVINNYKKSSNGIAAARKAFIHEVGHALKLSHPYNSSSYSGHNYSGYPIAIMNQGNPGSKNYISGTITNHDKSCLTAKWGV